MLAKLRVRRPSHSTTVAYLALFVALGGGAYAATSLPDNSVGTRQLKNNAVVSPKIKDGGVRRADIAKRAVSGSRVAKNSLTGFNIVESSLGTVPNAARLGGVLAAGYQRSCLPGSIAAHVYVKGSSTFSATYTTGGLQDSFNCTGATTAAQVLREATGIYRVDFPGIDPAGHLVAAGNTTVDQASTQAKEILTYKLILDSGLARTVYRVETFDPTGALRDREFSFSVDG